MGRPDMTKLEMAFRGREPEREPLHCTACGLDDVYLVNGFIREQIDGEDAITIEDMDGLWKAIGLALVTKRKALASKDIRFLRGHMDFTQAELGANCACQIQSVARWEKGENPIPGPADVLLRVLFLACERAQPQGGKILERLISVLEDLHERDEPEQRIMFRHKKKWEQERPAELEYA
jgi:DNA-binding transcriptional regulator YiaG